MHDLAIDADGTARCGWCGDDPLYRAYHDDEWGRPTRGDDAIFELLSLEGFQAGLSWLTILRKREAFKAAFAGFSISRVAEFDERDVERLLADSGIVRHRGKIEATIGNAVAALDLEGGLSELVWSFAPPRPARRAGVARRPPACDARVDGALEGAQAAWLSLRRTDDGLRTDGVGRARRRPSRGLSRRELGSLAETGTKTAQFRHTSSATLSDMRTISTPWGKASAVEEVTVAQRAGAQRFATIVQLLETADGERLVRFAYTTDGSARRGPVTLRARDVERMKKLLERTPELRDALGR